MKRLIWLITILIIGSVDSADTLYLILGNPHSMMPGKNHYSRSDLFVLTEKKLSLLRPIAAPKFGVNYIHVYSDKKIVIMGGPIVAPTNFIWFETANPAKINSFCFNFENNFKARHYYLFSDYSSDYFGAYTKNYGVEKTTAHPPKFVAYNIKNKLQQELPFSFYKYIQTPGLPGINLNVETYFLLRAVQDKNLYVLILGGPVIESDYTLPDEFRKFYLKDTYNVICADIANSFMLVTHGYTRDKKYQDQTELDPDKIIFPPYITLHILNKKTNTWKVLTFPGFHSRVRSFGPWMAGYSMERADGRISPGAAERRKTITETGYPIDWYFKEENLYCPGLLFFYNVLTEKRYEIRTNQGDSEIILIDNDIVYYRSNTKIFKAQIGDKSIGKTELLVDDPRVPDIHWAFIGPLYDPKTMPPTNEPMLK